MPTIHESVESTTVKLQDYAQETRAAFGRRAKKARAKAANALQALQASDDGSDSADDQAATGGPSSVTTGGHAAEAGAANGTTTTTTTSSSSSSAIPACACCGHQPGANAAPARSAPHKGGKQAPDGAGASAGASPSSLAASGVYVEPTPPDSPASGAATPRGRSAHGSATASPDGGPTPALLLPSAVTLLGSDGASVGAGAAGSRAGGAEPPLGGRGVAEMGEQLDRIEAAVLSLADAFGKLQRQVGALQQAAAQPAAGPQPGAPQTAEEAVAASPRCAGSATEAPGHAAAGSSPRASCSSVGTSWDDESFAEPTSEA